MEIIPDGSEDVTLTAETVIEVTTEPAPEPVAEPEVVAEVTTEPTPEPTPEPRKAPSMVPLRVLQERVGEETSKRQQAERRATDLQAILDRMQRGDATPAPVAPASAPDDQDIEARVEARVTQREATKSIGAVIQAGRSEFTATEWNEKAEILGAVGAASPEFVMDVIAAAGANAHKVLFSLAQEPERAADLAAMDIRSRTAELTRMSMSVDKPAVVTEPVAKPAASISKAPTPKPVIAPHAPVADVDPRTPAGNEKMDDKSWESWYRSTYMKRA